jgi:outer membrane immunogenic protein
LRSIVDSLESRSRFFASLEDTIMNKILLSAAISVIVFGLTSSCFAQNVVHQVIPGKAYFGFAMGFGGMDTPDWAADSFFAKIFGRPYKVEVRDGVSGRIFAGYLWTNDQFKFGPELGYLTYPDNKYSIEYTIGKSVYSGYTVDLLAVGQYHFNPSWNIFAKVGIAYVSQELNLYDHMGGYEHYMSHKFREEGAVGVGYHFNPTFEVNATYANIRGETPKEFTDPHDKHVNNVARIYTVMLGFVFHIV